MFIAGAALKSSFPRMTPCKHNPLNTYPAQDLCVPPSCGSRHYCAGQTQRPNVCRCLLSDGRTVSLVDGVRQLPMEVPYKDGNLNVTLQNTCRKADNLTDSFRTPRRVVVVRKVTQKVKLKRRKMYSSSVQLAFKPQVLYGAAASVLAA